MKKKKKLTVLCFKAQEKSKGAGLFLHLEAQEFSCVELQAQNQSNEKKNQKKKKKKKQSKTKL